MISDLNLFLFQCKVMFLSFGGGPASIPFYEDYFVNEKQIISKDEFKNAVIKANIINGPMFVILAVIFGRKIKNIKGIILMLAPLFLISLITILLYKNLENNIFILEKIKLIFLPILLTNNLVYIFKELKKELKNYLFIIFFFISLILFYFKVLSISILIILLIILSLIIGFKKKND